MAWEWHEITSYKVSIGSVHNKKYLGNIQLFGNQFYGLLTFHKGTTIPNATAPNTHGQRFYGHMDLDQMPIVIDILRNEKPLRFGWFSNDPNLFHLMTGAEAVGEGDGVLATES